MPAATAVTIGNFDGVHRGHRALLEVARSIVGEDGTVVALVFDPHPLEVLDASRAPARLTHSDQRHRLLQQAGADKVVPLAPTRELLSQSPREFIAWVIEQHQPAAIVEGPDFRFGRGRSGSTQTLSELGAELGFQAVVVPAVEWPLIDCHLVPVSSSIIRWLVQQGRVADAERLLAGPYQLQGVVVQGDKRGRELGMPTVNLDCGDQLLPADGVYAGMAFPGQPQESAMNEHNSQNAGPWPAAISVGVKPTFNGSSRVCEAHLLDYDGPLDDYHWPLGLQFHDWLRDQVACRDIESLKRLMRDDIEQTRLALQRRNTTTLNCAEAGAA